MNEEAIQIYFTDEPIVDAILTKQELLAALQEQRGETSLPIESKSTIR